MKEFIESTDRLHDADALRQRMSEDGYLYFRQLLPKDPVAAVRASIASVLADSEWLADEGGPGELIASQRAVGEGTVGFFGAYTAIQMLQEFHELAQHPALLDLTERVLGEPVFCRPAHICRIAPPAAQAVSTPPHQDYRLIQGSVDTLTTWIPLADAPVGTGGLRVLSGSHQRGLLPVDRAEGPGGQAAKVEEDDARWRTTSFTAGDVLLFFSLSVHGALPNTSRQLRLSADFRYHPLAGPVAVGGRGFKPHYYPNVPDYPTLTKGWTSTHSITAPAELHWADRFDPKDPDLTAPQSRFVTHHSDDRCDPASNNPLESPCSGNETEDSA